MKNDGAKDKGKAVKLQLFYTGENGKVHANPIKKDLPSLAKTNAVALLEEVLNGVFAIKN
ncbi:MAG: hypothetical protein IPN76_17950 [Saprospiraceae bacterium]|nr:hypothetical protein [Saprospiraceae bacterium]